jgi:FkbM family methyltransferase
LTTVGDGVDTSYHGRVRAVPPFISFAQNAEDVVLHRALLDVTPGRYVEVGACDPTDSSITRAFYDRGWSGIAIEPVTGLVESFRSQRPRDTVVQAAVTDADVGSVTLHVIEGTGLSTLEPEIAERHRASGWSTTEETVPARRLDAILDEHLRPEDDIHFMVVDTEGSERAVLASVDLRRWRPWILVVEATAPNTTRPTHDQWEAHVLAAGYEFCLFDGLSRFYVAEEHADRLRPQLSYPANVLDNYVSFSSHRRDQELAGAQAQLAQLRAEHEDTLAQLTRWRGTVLERWAEAVGTVGPPSGRATHEVVRLRHELEAMRSTVSWRVTAPLRAVQERRLRGWR